MNHPYLRRLLGVGASFVATVCVAPQAHAQERLAVIIAAADDRALSDNLTEVAIARVAARGGHQLVGLEELREQLESIEVIKNFGIAACMKQKTCLTELGRVADVHRALLGNVVKDASGFGLDVVLFDTDTGEALAQATHQSELDSQRLIDALDRGIKAVLTIPSRPAQQSTPVRATIQLVPQAPRPPQTAHPPAVHVVEPAPVPKSIYVAYGTAALGAASFAAAYFTGQVATGDPTGATRADAQSDYERRQNYARATNGLLIAGAALSAVSATAFVWRW